MVIGTQISEAPESFEYHSFYQRFPVNVNLKNVLLSHADSRSGASFLSHNSSKNRRHRPREQLLRPAAGCIYKYIVGNGRVYRSRRRGRAQWANKEKRTSSLFRDEYFAHTTSKNISFTLPFPVLARTTQMFAIFISFYPTLRISNATIHFSLISFSESSNFYLFFTQAKISKKHRKFVQFADAKRFRSLEACSLEEG